MADKAPERIWAANITDGYGLWSPNELATSDPNGDVAVFIRADIHEKVVAERDQLRERVTFFENASKAYEEICDNRQREIDSLKRKLGYE